MVKSSNIWWWWWYRYYILLDWWRWWRRRRNSPLSFGSRDVIQFQFFGLNFLCDLRSITMTVILSLLPFCKASLERYSAAACEAGSGPNPLWEGSETAFFLCQRRSRRRAASQTSSFDRTSHKPSLARMMHSSSFVREMILTSGSGMIHGLRYLSPVWNEEVAVSARHKMNLARIHS